MNECIDLASKLEDTNAVVIVGEIGGDAEERLAKHITNTRFRKKVVAYIAGRHAPKEKRMGHAGAIIYGNFGTAESKIEALRDAGALIAMTPTEIPLLLRKARATG
jgi:succinyl-CoA synthetase alpha subunit